MPTLTLQRLPQQPTCVLHPERRETPQDAAAGKGPQGQPKPSAYGGVLVLAQVWTHLAGWDHWAAAGLRWKGQAGALLLFAVVALPLLPLRSVRAVAQTCGGSDALWQALGWSHLVTQRRLSRFLSSPRQDWLGVLGAMLRVLAQHPATQVGPDGVLAVDSFTVEKRWGPHLPGLRPVYDGVQRKLVDGYEVVSGCVVEGMRRWPLGFLPHRKADTAEGRQQQTRRRRKAHPGELPSKLDLALTLVQQAVAAGIAAQTVVGDSAYCVMWWLREVGALGRDWLVAMREDRRLRIGAQIQSIAAWVRDQRQQPQALQVVTEEASGWTVWGLALPEATLLDKGCNQKGLACRPCYFERRDPTGKVSRSWRLVTSQCGWDLVSVWEHWQERWPVEQLHRDSKQELEATAFHARRWEGIVAWLACASLRASVVTLLRERTPPSGGTAVWSVPALVQALGKTPCLVQENASGWAEVRVEHPLASGPLWEPPLPQPSAAWWPVRLKAA